MIKPSVRSPDSANGSVRQPINIVLDALQGVVKQRNGWKALCPAHDDTKPSLDVKVGDDGKVLVVCRSHGCSLVAIAEALGLEQADFFPRVVGAPTRGKVKVSRGKPVKAGRPYKSPEDAIAWTVKQFGSPSGHWIYRGIDRFELMRVYRWDFKEGGKEYRPVHPDADGWYLGDPPGKLPLYNLHKLASAQTVLVTEGEKCADLVESLGLTGTTSAHGVNSRRATDWSPLAGKQVIILPDHENGEHYFNDAGEILAAIEPRPEIRVLRLPLAGKGDDIEQWLDTLPDSWTPEDCRAKLEELAKETAVWNAEGGFVSSGDEDDDCVPIKITPWPDPPGEEAYSGCWARSSRR